MKLATIALIALTAGAAAVAGAAPNDTYHDDHRTTAKIRFEPAGGSPRTGTPQDVARTFLAQQADLYDLPRDLANLVPGRTRTSLLADHVEFQQMLNDLPVEGGEVIVSVARQDGRILRTFNNIYPVGPAASFVPRSGIDAGTAYDLAWQRLRAYGELRSLPAARLVYTPEGETFRLNWLVDLDLDGPDGAWRVRVDALSGEAVEITDMRVTRVPQASVAERLAGHEGPLADRAAAFAAIAEREARRQETIGAEPASRAAGTGIVFDPDPRTTLLNNSLQNASPAASFTGSYFTRDLQDIEFSGGLYRLNGPWVYILNWDPPATAPSTTTDGHWISNRGPNSFNDAVTYFHLDQNQRYMQSLGFTGATGIQYGSIGTDTDGFSGADNSAYYPGTNRLTFGHGCVDDNEDADVILHEYGHAINHDINNSWTGGDTGGMGEGWGDYWGGSYSYSTPNGPDFFPEWIYTWDGHGVGNQCWPGRVMNAFTAQYVHTTIYGAHQSIPGGWQSDELWSTPLFQSLLTLVETHGETRESVDRILLESQFGLGSGLKMRDMANVIIATCRELEPTGPHADVFIAKFLVHNIILPVVPSLGVMSFDVTAEPSGNGAADPGETVSVQVVLSNTGSATATGVTATLATALDGITVVQNSADFGDLVVGGNGAGDLEYTFSVAPDVACGTMIPFTLHVTYLVGATPAAIDLAGRLFVGVPVGAYGTASPNAPLPDNTGVWVISTITIDSGGALVSENLNIDVNITHSNIGDLIVRLHSPSGTTCLLHAFGGGTADNIIGNYPNTLTPGQPLSRFLGQPLDGVWQLQVRDGGTGGTGTFNSWALWDITGFECDDGTIVAAPDAPPATFALGQNAPNPFNPATEISFAVPVDAGLVALDVFDLRGHKVRTLERSHLAAGQHARTWDGRDDRGTRVGSGTYVYRLTGNGFVESRKMVIVQ